jgi:hypothetical protein
MGWPLMVASPRRTTMRAPISESVLALAAMTPRDSLPLMVMGW